MKNSIVISVEFCFKGKKHAPFITVDLDSQVHLGNGYEILYRMLAKSINIDLYSYEYEMMLSEDLIYTDATGLAENYLEDGKFDLPAFEQALQDESITKVISKIASDHLSIDDLSSQPDLKAALIEAYKIGQKS